MHYFPDTTIILVSLGLRRTIAIVYCKQKSFNEGWGLSVNQVIDTTFADVDALGQALKTTIEHLVLTLTEIVS